MENRVILVSAGMIVDKQSFTRKKNIENLYVNQGLLGLATVLKERGYECMMFQGDRKPIMDMISDMENSGVRFEQMRYPLLLSVSSFYAVAWANAFTEAVKMQNPDLRVIAGGRWVFDKNREWAKEKMPQIDFFSLGCPEQVIEKLLYPENWKLYEEAQRSSQPFTHLDFSLLHHFEMYQPQIEVARGCPNGCKFCLESEYRPGRAKEPEQVLQEAEALCRLYKDEQLNIYFEAAIFSPNPEWAKRFAELYKKKKMQFHWRFETRVDSMQVESIPYLAQAGLKVVDLGLESASELQLLRMNKTKNPKQYLARADRLLRALSESHVWAKINLILYVGETEETICESRAWLEKRRNLIKGVSINPLTIYLNGADTEGYILELETLGNITINTTSLYEHGYMNIDLSKEIILQRAKEVADDWSGLLMSNRDYEELKSVCYTPRV